MRPIPPADICRVCRGEATAEQPLFYPCLCSGSIKYVHQEWYGPVSAMLITLQSVRMAEALEEKVLRALQAPL